MFSAAAAHVQEAADRLGIQLSRHPLYRYDAMTQLSRREFTVAVLGAGAAATRAAQAAPLSPTTRSMQTPGRASTDAHDALAALTLADAAARLRAGTVTSVDLVNACLARIDIYNP
ncbi:MAG TPA: hypothetical protein VKE51_09220, partial [Vicinamibacterales bacterium]|nr:hypothetical protein [Vicinamibacterales bacterium]